MSAADTLLRTYWKIPGPKSVALWADSTYGPFEPQDLKNLAKELGFPLTSFTCSFGGGLTCKGDFHDPAGDPADVVIIEMGYNDPHDISAQEAANRMRQRKWYGVLQAAGSRVKCVVFVNQPSYKQVCPPRPKKKKKGIQAGWVKGSLVRGSKWTNEAIYLVQEELGIPALVFDASPQELFADMFIADKWDDSVYWQNEAKCRKMVNHGEAYSEDGELALWEDSEHPTAAGANLHFRCLVSAFIDRYEHGRESSGWTQAQSAAAPQIGRGMMSALSASQPQAAWANWNGASSQAQAGLQNWTSEQQAHQPSSAGNAQPAAAWASAYDALLSGGAQPEAAPLEAETGGDDKLRRLTAAWSAQPAPAAAPPAPALIAPAPATGGDAKKRKMAAFAGMMGNLLKKRSE